MWKMVLVLVVIVVVSWVALTAGALRHPGDPMQVVEGTPRWLKGLFQTKLEASALVPAQDACSRSGRQLSIDGFACCQLRIAEGGRRSRQSDLLMTGGTAIVAFKPGPIDTPQPVGRDMRLETGQRFPLVVGAGGGRLAIQCATAGGCTLQTGLQPGALGPARDACSRSGVQLSIDGYACCLRRIAKGGVRVRRADLVMTSGADGATVGFQPEPADAPRPAGRDKRVVPGQRFRLDVYSEGGRLAILCPSATGCALRVAPPK